MTTLVLLHAFPLDSSMYDAVRGPLGEVCDLLTPDFPGFGGGPLPEGEPSLDRYADAVAAELDARGLGRVVLGGTSMGGYTAMAFLRAHPDRVSGLVLLDTKASADPAEAAAGRRAMADRLEREGSADALVEAVYPKLLGTTTTDQRPEVAERVRTAVAEASPWSAAWAQRAMAARPDSFDTLRAVAVPTLVVVGAEDVLSPPTDAAAMVAAIPEASLAMVPEAGHLTPVEAPDVVVDVVSAFLGRLR
jgi:pimeloyl-ACP methyl ester carboxylesterase